MHKNSSSYWNVCDPSSIIIFYVKSLPIHTEASAPVSSCCLTPIKEHYNPHWHCSLKPYQKKTRKNLSDVLVFQLTWIVMLLKKQVVIYTSLSMCVVTVMVLKLRVRIYFHYKFDKELSFPIRMCTGTRTSSKLTNIQNIIQLGMLY